MIYPAKLRLIVTLTDMTLQKETKKETTIAEIMEFFGIWVLATKIDFGSRNFLWSTTAISKYATVPAFGSTGMTCHSSIRFGSVSISHISPMRPQKVCCPRCIGAGWFINFKIINNRREAMFRPSTTICVECWSPTYCRYSTAGSMCRQHGW